MLAKWLATIHLSSPSTRTATAIAETVRGRSLSLKSAEVRRGAVIAIGHARQEDTLVDGW